MKTILFILATSLFAGCYTETDVGYRATYVAPAYVAPAPGLVYVSPGVEVIADYDYPVFYSGGVYWRYDGGFWYSSRVHTGGWVRSYNVPVAVRSIDRPAAYAHYRAGARASVRTAPTHTTTRARVRDHRR
jgi:hypothetical protein